MFFRMVKGAFVRQWKKMMIIAFTISLGASLATAMLSVVLDVGDKVNKELKTFGANITVIPKRASVVSDLYDVKSSGSSTGVYLKENELGKIKTIFWAFNIVDYTPFIKSPATLPDGSKVSVVGSWFNHHMNLPTGEQLDAGIASLRSWWEIKDGKWIDEQVNPDENACMIGENLAKRLQLKSGDSIKVKGSKSERNLSIVGVFSSGGDEDENIFTGLKAAQSINGLEGKIDSIEVSALTTPDNELAMKAAKNPKSLTVAQYEIWYCTAYVSSICYQIQEVITDSVASPVRQVADSEGAILDKTQLLMILITILSLIGSALGICNLVTASVMERSGEIGLMKAIGAHNSAIIGIVLTEIIITAIIGGIVGFGFGIGFAQIVGKTVFNSFITIRLMVVPIVAVLVVIVTLIGSIPAIKMLLNLEPEEVLHGR